MLTFEGEIKLFRSKMIRVSDQMGNEIRLSRPAQRIVSLVPSQTELLFDLGASDAVVGVTKFCIHPADAVAHKSKIGGTKTLNIEKIRALEPDLVIGNKEENVKEQIESLQTEFPVYMSDIVSIEEALGMIQDLGILCGKETEAIHLRRQVEQGFRELEQDQPAQGKLTAIYLIWENPIMAVGADNFIDEMMKKAGLENPLSGRIFLHPSSRYPEISVEQIAALNPDLLLLSSEPYPFKEKHVEKYRKLLPHIRIEQVDGEMFSWYGSSMLKAIPYLRAKLKSWQA
jgi:ABC-type Fe3+-hydroxamate transport system substrate-binding protein